MGLACAVTFCCVWPLGLIAVGLAIAAYNRTQQGNQESARKFGRASVGVSIASIVVGVVLIVVIIVLTMTTSARGHSTSTYNNNNGNYYG
jgi:uncharacterized membrane protein YidH (DUF202 family)